jgi:hypothetical protein
VAGTPDPAIQGLNLIYYFESSRTPNTFGWISRSSTLSAGAQTKKLELTGGQIYAGEVSGQFSRQPFRIR